VANEAHLPNSPGVKEVGDGFKEALVNKEDIDSEEESDNRSSGITREGVMETALCGVGKRGDTTFL
jgi:hypothetical protein